MRFAARGKKIVGEIIAMGRAMRYTHRWIPWPERPNREVDVRSSRAGFTLVEMLVVIALIVAMTSMAVGAYGSFLSSKQVQLGTKLIGNAYRAGRQYAISNRVPCLVEFQAPNLDNIAPVDGVDLDPKVDHNLVRVIPFETVVIPETGELRYQLSGTSVYEKKLPGKLVFTRVPYEVGDDAAETGVLVDIFAQNPDTLYEDLWGIVFWPDGSASETDDSVWIVDTSIVPLSAPMLDTTAPQNTVDIFDPISREKARVYVFPATGYTREFYYHSAD